MGIEMNEFKMGRKINQHTAGFYHHPPTSVKHRQIKVAVISERRSSLHMGKIVAGSSRPKIAVFGKDPAYSSIPQTLHSNDIFFTPTHLISVVLYLARTDSDKNVFLIR
jgi:hypothetical protein